MSRAAVGVERNVRRQLVEVRAQFGMELGRYVFLEKSAERQPGNLRRSR